MSQSEQEMGELKLYRDRGCKGLIGGASPYIYKLETWLRLAGIPYVPRIMSPTKLMETAPRGLVPYIDLDGEIISDSSIIIERLEVLHNDPLNDNRLTREQHAQGGMIKSLCEHELFYILAYGRFIDGDYRAWCEHFFSGDNLPEDQLDATYENFRAFVKERLDVWRLGRYDADFVRQELRKCLEILSCMLGEGPWLFGKAPSSYDAALYGMLASIIHFPIPNPHVQISHEYIKLVDYCDRVRKQVYDYDPE